MKRKLIFLFVILGIAGLAILTYKFISSRTPKDGVLKVTSNPPVSIFLDNRHLGRTPYQDKIEEGEYTIKLTPESAVEPVSPWQGKIKIFPNLLTYVNADLKASEFNSSVDILWLEKITSRQSEISVVTNPDGATVTLDGDTKGTSPITIPDVSVGDHTILLTSPGFAPHTVKVKTTAGYKLIATLKLALSEQNLYQPEATATPVASLSGTLAPTAKSKVTPSPSAKATPKISLTPTREATGSPTPKQSPTPKPTMPDPEKPYIIIKDTPTGFLRVRSEPTTAQDNEIGRVYPGEKYSILDYQNGWYKISFEDNKEGWVSGQYVEKVE